MTLLFGNASATWVIGSHSPVAIKPANVAVAIWLFMCFLVGTAINGLFLWVLGVKLKRTVNTLWFFHLILTHFICCPLLPFYAVYILLGLHWVFGTAMCKLTSFSLSFWMFFTIFLLTIISLDRYLLTCHPIWSQHNRTIPRAKKLIAGLWFASLALSTVFLPFRETQVVEKGRVICEYNCTLSSGDWDGERLQLTLFLLRFLLAFLIPFFVITCSYCWMGQEMKKKKLVRTGKPYRDLVAAVASFFICWLPFHLYYGSQLLKAPEIIIQALWGVASIAGCFSLCFTPILYLFVGEKFQQVFKMSIIILLKKAFVENPINSTAGEDGHRTDGNSSTEVKMT